MRVGLTVISDFRIFAEETKDGTVYSVHEVFYLNDQPIDYVGVPLVLISTDEEDLIGEIQLVLEAFEKPTLSLEYFPEEF